MGPELSREAILKLPLPDARVAEAALKALGPEAERFPTGRFSARISLEGRALVIRIRARDTSSLRAAINSFMSWVKAIRDACASVSSSEDR